MIVVRRVILAAVLLCAMIGLYVAIVAWTQNPYVALPIALLTTVGLAMGIRRATGSAPVQRRK